MPAVPSQVSNTGQVAMTGSAVQIVQANASRKRVTFVMGGATPADTWLGNAGVAQSGAGSGILLAGVKGQTLTFESQAAFFGNGASTAIISFLEETN